MDNSREFHSDSYVQDETLNDNDLVHKSTTTSPNSISSPNAIEHISNVCCGIELSTTGKNPGFSIYVFNGFYCVDSVIYRLDSKNQLLKNNHYRLQKNKPVQIR